MNDMTNLQKGIIDRDSDEAQDRFIKGYAGGAKRGVDRANRTIDGIASTIELDRDNEIILPSSFRKRMGKFMGGNSPFLDAHQQRASGPTQIGWIMEMKLSKQNVTCKFRFVDEPDPTSPANRWWSLASDPKGKGIAFSIGFIPVRWVYGSVTDLVAEFPEIREPLRNAGMKGEDKLRVYTEIELLCISAVPVGSNRGALQILTAKFFGDIEGGSGEFVKELAAAVAAQLKADAGELVQGELLESSYDLKSEIMDRISELTELIMLGSVAPPVAASQDVFVAPPADGSDGKAGPGETDGAAGARDAARSLLKTCRQ